MSKWSNVPISGTHDWDRDLSNLLTGNDNASAPLEVDWTDPDAIAANRGMVADVMLALESFMGPVIVSQTKPGERRVRAALGLSEDGYRGLAEQAGMVARTVTEARECGCGNLHPCGLADGSMLFAGVEQGKPPEFRLAPWWQGEGGGE